MSNPPNDAKNPQYKKKWKSIVKVITNQNLGVSRVAQAGSRARKNHHKNSDMDVIFALSNNPSREIFYPKLIKILKGNYPNDHIYPGSNNNVVHIKFRNDTLFDLVLLSENQFDSQHKGILNFRKENL